MKTILLLLFITACSHCPDKVYRKCLSWRTEMYMGSLGRGHHIMHREHCEQWSDQVYVNYNCKTYKLGEECKDEN